MIPINAQFFIPIGITDSTITTTQSNNQLVGKPFGGGTGYFPIIKPEESNIIITTNDFNSLKTVLANASYGDTIYVNDNLQIEIPLAGTLTIPDGVTLASGRGRNGSKGALIFSNNFLETDYLFNYPAISAGNDVQITGLRLRGPDSTSSSVNYGKQAVGIKQENKNNLEVHNCEIYNWYVYGIFLIESDNAIIHHNYIHNNQNPHIGYGICNRNKTNTIISYNIFNRNRHDIAGVKNTNMEPPSYTAQYNLIGPDAISHRFDMHGCGYTDLWGCPDMYAKDDAGPDNLAGGTINILNNYFIPMNYPKYHSVVIRGIPRDVANISGNYFPNDYMSEPDYPVRQTLMWGDPINSECKPIDSSYEWNLTPPFDSRNSTANGECVYNGILQVEPNHINFVDNIIGQPVYLRVINWDVQSSNQVLKVVGPEVRFTNQDISSFAYGDFNNDGRTDILYQDYVSWSGLTEWEVHTEYHSIDPNHIIDFNGDGIEDKLNIVYPNTIWP
ncbi:MAG: hypothetical protein GWP19_02620 [Planctomycetia bacterium]|nr:hypothetical protein [Planctomycetia bacterium]